MNEWVYFMGQDAEPDCYCFWNTVLKISKPSIRSKPKSTTVINNFLKAHSFITLLLIMPRPRLHLTSMPSRFIMALSIFKMAVLMVRGGGKLVRPMLIAFERFASNTLISFLLPSCFWNKQSKEHLKQFSFLLPSCFWNKQSKWGFKAKRIVCKYDCLILRSS